MLVLRRSRVHSLAIITLIALAACKEAADPEPVASIVGLNAVDSVRLGRTMTLSVQTLDAKGNRLTGRRVTWSSLAPTVAAVDANGVVTATNNGTTVITARADGASATMNLMVQAAATSVVLSPATSSVAIGSTRPLTVVVTDKDGKAIAGRTVVFSSSNTTVATVNASGVVVGIAQGSVTITGQAVLDQVSGTAKVDVTQVPVNSVSISPAGSQTVFQGDTKQLSAVLRDANNTILTGRPVSWTTSNQAVATVSSDGLVTGVSLGTAQITAESEGKTASTQVTVAPRPVATIALGPNPGSVKVGQSLQMLVDLRDAGGNQLSLVGRSVFWDSSNRPVASVQSDGVVNGISVGSATISVTVDGKTASALVNVSLP